MSHTQFTRRLGWIMAFIGFALTITIGGWSLGALLAFGLFIGALIYLVNRETMHTLDKTDRELAEQQRTIRRLARQRQRMHGGGGFR
jgi:F0F1-type ATP synthase membrane subunit b/b'